MNTDRLEEVRVVARDSYAWGPTADSTDHTVHVGYNVDGHVRSFCTRELMDDTHPVREFQVLNPQQRLPEGWQLCDECAGSVREYQRRRRNGDHGC